MNKFLRIIGRPRIWIFGLVVICSGMFIANTTSLLISPSRSLSQRVFFLVKGVQAHKGQLVALRGHRTAYFSDLLYTKRIYGIEGDHIGRRDGFMTINGHKVLKLQAHTTKGQCLTPLKTQTIPKGYVFVAGDHPRSFDSRYEEFGLVKGEHLLGRVWVVF